MNIMRVDRLAFRIVLLALAAVMVGCSSEQAEQDAPVETNLTVRETDSLAIQASLTEIITRWRHGDKSALYEQEFDYLRFEYSYDEFLEFEHVKDMNADSAYAFNVKGLKFFDRDSADVKVEVVFKGVTGNLTYDYDTYKMYRSHDRWVRPSFSAPQMQAEFEEARRIADSAAAAEEDLEY